MNHNLAIQQQSKLVYEFTSNSRHLEQYARLVIQYYKKDLNLDLTTHNMTQSLCAQEENERIFIVRDGDKVIAGTKITFAALRGKELLPMENEHFRVPALLPEHFTGQSYAEIGRLVVDPDYRGKEVLTEVITELFGFCHQQGTSYIFVLAPPLNSVLYRRICRSMGLNVIQHKDVDWGSKAAYDHLNLQLISCDIGGLFQQASENFAMAG